MLGSKEIVSQIYERLRNAKRVGIVFHKNPDGDSLGSGLALALYCERLRIPYLLFCATAVGAVYRKLPRVERIGSDPTVFDTSPCDVVITVDAGDAGFAGIAGIEAMERACVINMDHHPTNSRYGTINHIVPSASATAEVVWSLFESWNVRLSPAMATLLLVGIFVDTDEFTNPGTTSRSFECATRLLSRGADVGLARRVVRGGKQIQTLPVWGAVLDRISYDPTTKIATTVIMHDDGKDAHDPIEGIPNFLNCLSDMNMTVVIKQVEGGRVHCSFRTVRDDVDVGLLAQQLGGGGHRKAAGFSLPGVLEKGEEGTYSIK